MTISPWHDDAELRLLVPTLESMFPTISTAYVRVSVQRGDPYLTYLGMHSHAGAWGREKLTL